MSKAVAPVVAVKGRCSCLCATLSLPAHLCGFSPQFLSAHETYEKIFLYTACSLISCFNSYCVDIPNGVFELRDGESLRLEYNPMSQTGESVQTLYLKSHDKEVVVNMLLAEHQIYANGSHGLKPYEKCSIIAADHKSNELLVLYAFENGKQQIFQANDVSRGYAKPSYTEQDLLLVSYFKEKNTWETLVSVHIQTFWGDILGEKVSGVAIAGKLSYEIQFKQNWTIEGTQTEVTDTRHKIIENGSAHRRLQMDEESKQIYSIDDNGNRFFTMRSVWWSGENAAHIENMRIRADLRMRAESEAKKKGLMIPAATTAFVDKLKSRKIEVTELRIIPNTKPLQSRFKITKDLRKQIQSGAESADKADPQK